MYDLLIMKLKMFTTSKIFEYMSYWNKKTECKWKPTVSKNLITFSTSSTEGYTVSSQVLMPVPETD